MEMFGTNLGTGDYGHLTIEHVPMLFRAHCSLHHLSNQGFEAAHKLHKLKKQKLTNLTTLNSPQMYMSVTTKMRIPQAMSTLMPIPSKSVLLI